MEQIVPGGAWQTGSVKVDRRRKQHTFVQDFVQHPAPGANCPAIPLAVWPWYKSDIRWQLFTRDPLDGRDALEARQSACDYVQHLERLDNLSVHVQGRGCSTWNMGEIP